ncbi:MAG: SUMF1/EgtB/PvdO family nonheme iron enzyme [Verrucomicrobia bacterium]|nr:SUMF1/EgtB/PvdO family nonheme iron enzyme [Verrucomicrobiota bacterium]
MLLHPPDPLLAAQAAAPDTKAVGRVRLDPLPSKDTEGNAGLFVGIGKFDPQFGLPGLRFTPDDAVALAYHFVIELKLIPPTRATVALGGEPESDAARSKLLQLQREKVRRIAATRNDLFPAVSATTKSSTDTNALIVMSFSTHGFEKEGRAYVMPYDGNREYIEETGIPLQTVKTRLQEAKANKKLLIIDACRESPNAQTRGASRMNEQLLQALRKSEGMAILSSCAVGQLSWEADELKQGVFTYFLLRALEGAAPADARDGLIRLDKVAEYTIAATRDWVKRNRSEDQQPFFEAGLARDIPLAFSRIDREAAEKLKVRRSDGLRYLSDAYFAPGNLVPDRVLDEVQQAVTATEGPELETLIANLEGLKGARPAAIKLFVAWFQDWWGRRRTDKPATVASVPSPPPAPRPQPPASATETPPAGRKTLELDLGGGVKMTLVRLSKGSFLMGSAQGRGVISTAPGPNAAQVKDDSGNWLRLGLFLGTGVDFGAALQQNVPDQSLVQQQAPVPAYDAGEGGPQTRVRLTEDFWMSETEITQAQWKTVMGTTLEQQQTKTCELWRQPPSSFPLRGVGEDFPMYYVSWTEATEFCTRLARLARRSIRLPTEAQWEYACRAGATTRFSFGDDERQIQNYAWTSDTGGTNPVKSKRPNAWGLYDLHGNVTEWCLDYFGLYPGGSVEDPVVLSAPLDLRVVRGGSWGAAPETATVSRRFRVPPQYMFPNLGFRVVAKDEP